MFVAIVSPLSVAAKSTLRRATHNFSAQFPLLGMSSACVCVETVGSVQQLVCVAASIRVFSVSEEFSSLPSEVGSKMSIASVLSSSSLAVSTSVPMIER